MLPPLAPTGRFVYDAGTATWDWDEGVYQVHGLEPGSVSRLTTDFVLSCKHPEDRARVAASLLHASQTGEPFSLSYRVIGGDGVERRVVLVGEGAARDGEETYDLHGYYIDLTADFEAESQEAAGQAVAASAESRATIEQAKGALMLAYGLDEEQSFAMLRWWSRNRNVKVRDLARWLLESINTGALSDVDLRQGIDALLHDAPGNAVTGPPG